MQTDILTAVGKGLERPAAAFIKFGEQLHILEPQGMDIRAQRVDTQVEGMPHQEDDREGDEPGDCLLYTSRCV